MTIDDFISHRLPATLVLEDGTVFSGFSIGAIGTAFGEVVFNTAMTGYQEIISDPSYAGQMVTLTHPHIGNVGVNSEDEESDHIWVSGIIIKKLSPVVSSWRSTQSLDAYLKERHIVGISDIDTRALTHLLRKKGAMRGCVVSDTSVNLSEIKAKLKDFPSLEGQDLASRVSRKSIESWKTGTLDFESLEKKSHADTYHVVVYDYGVKQQILRLFVDRGCQVTVVPAKTALEDVLALNPDGVFLSNGPGDPAACDYAIEVIQALLKKRMPIFGICLGFQLLALACGAQTKKMKFGHHGANHPVQSVSTKKVYITSQNHSFMVERSSLPDVLQPTHFSLFDGSLQGIAHRDLPAFAFQGHPEASPGPHDIVCLFDQFIEMLKEQSYAKTK